jgi:hypothetical protein
MDRLPVKRRHAIPVQLNGRYPVPYWDDDGGVFTQVPSRQARGPSANKAAKVEKPEGDASGYLYLKYPIIFVVLLIFMLT